MWPRISELRTKFFELLARYAKHLTGKHWRFTYDDSSFTTLWRKEVNQGGYRYDFKRPFVLTRVTCLPGEERVHESRNFVTGKLLRRSIFKFDYYHCKAGPAVENFEHGYADYHLFGEMLYEKEFLRLAQLSDVEILVQLIQIQPFRVNELLTLLAKIEEPAARAVYAAFVLSR